MNSFSLFDYLDPTIINAESSESRASKSPAAWPSEASAYRSDRSFFPIYGACMRKAFYRMIAWPKLEETTADSPWKWVIGRAVEDKLTDLCALASAQFEDKPVEPVVPGTPPKIRYESLYVANGVKHYIKSAYLSIEMDVVVRDPKTNKGWIVECKSYDGYFAEKQIENELKPKEENLMQICLYLWEAKNGKLLKHMILESMNDRKKLDAIGATHRNRCEANEENLMKMNDGEIGAKLVYISRGECNRTEFDISIMQAVDGFHYPVVNGIPYKIFSIESIYDRFTTLQTYWFRARTAAHDSLEERGILPPPSVNLLLNRGEVPDDNTIKRELTKDEWAAEKAYFVKLENEVRALPESFFPKPEYEYAYTPERIRELGDGKQIGKTKYDDWKKGKITRLGDWQCSYCPFASTGCVAKQRPDLAYQLYDIANLPDELEVSFGA
jgi:hypothetical protein